MSEQIEMIGINKLKDFILRTGFLIPYITDNDKTPSWDGCVYLYKNNNLIKNKIELENRIPVQVKSELNPNIFNEQIFFNMKKPDLNNYLRDGGVIIFVIRMKDFDNYRIYYEKLNPIKIKRYLKKMKKGKSINVKLYSIPINNIEILTDIFFNFSDDIRKFPSDKILSLNDLNKYHPDGFDSITMNYRGIQYNNPMDYFLSNEVTVYAYNSVAEISLPIDLIKISEFSHHINSSVLIENVEYYSNYNLTFSKEGIKIIIGNSFIFQFLKDKEKLIFQYSIHGSLSERIIDTKFFLALIKYMKFTITLYEKEPININIDKVEENINFQKENSKFNEYLNYLLEINKVLETLKVDNDLDLDNITKKDEENIQLLISSFLYNKPQNLIIKNENIIGSFRGNIKICNIIVSILFIKREDGKYSLSNFFNDRYIATYQVPSNGKQINVSIFLLLKKNDFLTLSNIDYDIIYKSFIKLNVEKALLEMTNQFILDMIDSYDQSKKLILLETSLKLINWILENKCLADHEIYLLNKIQIIKRMRTLSDDELSQLHNIITTSKNEKYLTGAYLLLGDISMAKFHLKKLSITDQNEFKEYPIYLFLNMHI